MIEARLRVVGGSEQDEFVLDLPATIGRGSDNSITLRDALISRQHCRIGVRDGSLVITDLDSLNGTYICLLYTSPSPRDKRQSRMPSSA